MELLAFNCTIRVIDLQNGEAIAEHVLPVNSPDPEHAAASTLANAASFTAKTEGGTEVKPIAFSCVRIERRID